MKGESLRQNNLIILVASSGLQKTKRLQYLCLTSAVQTIPVLCNRSTNFKLLSNTFHDSSFHFAFLVLFMPTDGRTDGQMDD